MHIHNLRRVDNKNIYDQSFTFTLRNDNRSSFFYDCEIKWMDHVKWLEQDGTRPDFDFFIIEWYGERAGTIAVEHRKDCEFLQNLCVASWARGHGLARWAIQELMLPNRFIIAQVKPENVSVINMYEELGFWRVK